MILAVAFPTWLQVGTTVAAAAAAVASWAAVLQARKAADDIRRAEAETHLPLLLVSPGVSTSRSKSPTARLSVHNAGGGVAKNVAVLLVVEDAYARYIVDFLRPDETIAFGSELHASDQARAVAFARSQDSRELVWDHEGDRRELERVRGAWPEWSSLFETFYPGEDLSNHRPTNLLRGDDRLS